MKFVIVEIDFTQQEEPTLGRIAGPYSEYEAWRVAKDLADEATESYENHETRKMEMDDVNVLTTDATGAFGSISVSDDEPSAVYIIKELLKV